VSIFGVQFVYKYNNHVYDELCNVRLSRPTRADSNRKSCIQYKYICTLFLNPVYARKCKGDSIDKLRASIDSGYNLLGYWKLADSIFGIANVKYNCHLVFYVTYSVVDAFRARCFFLFVPYPSSLSPSP